MKIIIFYKKEKNENYTFTLYLCYTYSIILIFDITFAATSFYKKINAFIYFESKLI